MTDTFGPPRQVVGSIYEISTQALEEIALWFETRGLRAQSILGLASAARAAVGVQTGVTIYVGSGSPNTAVTASPPALYLNTAGGSATTLWVKESGTNTNTGWVGK